MRVHDNREIAEDFRTQRCQLIAAAERGDRDFTPWFSAAENAYWGLRKQWGFDDLGALPTTTAGHRGLRSERLRNVLRIITFPEGSAAPAGVGRENYVLKLEVPWYPTIVSAHAMLSGWHAAVIPPPIVKSFAGGLTHVASGGPKNVDISLLEYLDGVALSGSTAEDRLRTIGIAARITEPLHLSRVSVKGARSWNDVMSRFDRANLQGLVDAGKLLVSVDEVCNTIAELSNGDVLAHGNLTAANIMEMNSDSKPHMLIDPMTGMLTNRSWELGWSAAHIVDAPKELHSGLLQLRQANQDLSLEGSIDMAVAGYAASIRAFGEAYACLAGWHAASADDRSALCDDWVDVALSEMTAAQRSLCDGERRRLNSALNSDSL